MAAGLGRVDVKLGMIFGKWTILGLDESVKRREAYYLCRCSCGFEKSVGKSSLLKGKSTRCRKCANSNNEKARIARRRPIPEGTRIGRWVVLGDAGVRAGNFYVRCRCDCGVEYDVLATMLRCGKSKSCIDCARSMTIEEGRAMTREWGGISSEYRAWSHMNERCRNPNMKYYERYGGRGIKVCKEWQGDGGFQRFIEHIGPKPSRDHSLERIDNNSGYEPGNVKWATKKEQARNKEAVFVKSMRSG